MFQRTAAALLAFVLFPLVAQPQTHFKGIHNATDKQYQDWVNGLGKESMHPIHVSVYGSGGGLRFAAIANDAFTGGYIARHDLTSEAYQKEFNQQSKDGYRLISISGYPKDNTVKYAAVWVQDGYQGTWFANHGQTDKEYQASFDANVKKGLRPMYVTGYLFGNSHRLASVFAADKYKDWQARHGMTADQYQKMFDEWEPKGYRPTCVNGYPTENGTRFALIMVKDKSLPWVAKHGLTAAEYQKQFDSLTAKGYWLMDVSGYAASGEPRYACVFAKPHLLTWPLPMTGTAVPSLSGYDDTMQKFMKDRHIQCGTLAVMHNGKLVLSRGYGYVDHEATSLCGPATPLRIASITKPLTLAALLKLIREGAGKLTANTKVVSYLGITAPTGQTMEKRWLDITVQHLIDHKGGWDRAKAGDPMFKSIEIAKALGKTGPATQDDIIRYMAGQPLQNNPGSTNVYSNFGYCILGRVIEKASGKKFIDYLQSDITKPLGLSSIQLGRTLPGSRNAKEPLYLDPNFDQNVMVPSSKVKVPSPDGGFYLEAMDSHGALIASAPDLAKFLQAYWIDGQPRKAGESKSFNFFGSLPGTHTLVLQRPDGTNLVALFNQRTDTSKLDYNAIQSMLNTTTDGIKVWPK